MMEKDIVTLSGNESKTLFGQDLLNFSLWQCWAPYNVI